MNELKVRIMSGTWAGMIGLRDAVATVSRKTRKPTVVVATDVGIPVYVEVDNLKVADSTLSYEDALAAIETWSARATEAEAEQARLAKALEAELTEHNRLKIQTRRDTEIAERRATELESKLAAARAERETTHRDMQDQLESMQAQRDLLRDEAGLLRAERDYHMERCDKMERARLAPAADPARVQVVKDLETQLSNARIVQEQLREQVSEVSDERDNTFIDLGEHKNIITALTKALARSEAEIRRLRSGGK